MKPIPYGVASGLDQLQEDAQFKLYMLPKPSEKVSTLGDNIKLTMLFNRGNLTWLTFRSAFEV